MPGPTLANGATPPRWHGLLAVAALSFFAGAVPGGESLAVIGVVPLSQAVTPGDAEKVATSLAEEFTRSARFDVRPAPKTEASGGASSVLSNASALRNKRDYAKAYEQAKLAVEKYVAAAPSVPAAAEAADAWDLLAALSFQTGRDAEGDAALSQALLFSRGEELPLEDTSKLYRTFADEARRELVARPTGSVRFQCALAIVPVTFDGADIGHAPVVADAVPEGTHLWTSRIFGGRTVGGFVTVGAGKQVVVDACAALKEAPATIAKALTANRVTSELVAALSSLAAQRTVDKLAFGMLTRRGDAYALIPFFFTASTRELRRFAAVKLDAKLIGLGVDLYHFAITASQTPNAGDVVTAPRPACAECQTSPPRTTTWTYSFAEPQLQAVPVGRESEPPAESPKRAPLRP